MAEKEKQIGITSKKDDDFSEWYTQVITKADLIDYSDVSGCYVLKPGAYILWERIQSFLDSKFKEKGVKNAYFPLLIPENYLNREADHVEGFSPEVAWVTETGNSKLPERLAIRPTSETIMYNHYAKWIRSWKDLPLKINQWCNIVRWEFNNPVPFLRSREFLWQEGHNVLATQKEMDEDVKEMLDVYAQCFEELLAIPVIKGMKSDKEKFAGADYTTSIETFMPAGKAIQCATSHALGQSFAKAFEISFTDQNEKVQTPWQDSWGFTTRSIGILIMYHSDDKGLVIPPKLAENKAVVVPIIFGDTKDKVNSEAKKLADELKEFNVILDDREDKTAGWKFNEWEMKGIPVRIEIGPKDIEKNQVVLVRRDTSEKLFVKREELNDKLSELLETMQSDLLENARKFMGSSTVEANSWEEVEQAIKDKKMIKMQWCCESECEDLMKDETGGAKTLNMPFGEKVKEGAKCTHCGKDAKAVVYLAKSY
ncbi:proline--tRNA ligase [Candidatus Woesearchaeota archaeon]|jgi:prolyl-tRNA synthetase|nr:proline--tRNA ligase [Candidatus Woesearchaeota archaeon]MBT3537735.1 proline--tRNA ligase [Candidatus Woesearchaeota archaeon]MBT4697866.1 proline--tRNA ligase [Candidatus Woesearchaeota archaeon]MBT4717474.1 proline--tRNA ligase [Candidatus Woesearchaeota archaeon]MBT7105404.1 proline--tRNA ligase [Candidatus Woesearchaeota archaeon]